MYGECSVFVLWECWRVSWAGLQGMILLIESQGSSVIEQLYGRCLLWGWDWGEMVLSAVICISSLWAHINFWHILITTRLIIFWTSLQQLHSTLRCLSVPKLLIVSWRLFLWHSFIVPTIVPYSKLLLDCFHPFIIYSTDFYHLFLVVSKEIICIPLSIILIFKIFYYPSFTWITYTLDV